MSAVYGYVPHFVSNIEEMWLAGIWKALLNFWKGQFENYEAVVQF